MQKPSPVLTLALLGALVTAPLLLTSCASSGSGTARTSTRDSPGFRGYYHRPWGYRPIYIGGRDREVDPDWGVEPDVPIAISQPDLGMPDFGGMDIDLGGFD